MKKQLSKYLNFQMIRPILRKMFTMMSLVVILAVLWDRFINTSGFVNTRTFVLPIFGAFFMIAAWFCFLRLDGVGTKSGVRRKKHIDPTKGFNEVVQTAPDNDDDMAPDARAFCSMAASLLCCAVCWLISAL